MISIPEESLEVPENGIRTVYAKNQPPYFPLSVIKFEDGRVYSEWEPTDEELALLSKGGKIRIRLWQYTFNQPLQPVRVELV